ncbi:hypothetical protein E2C01_011953 [Portunus trituberculatus]|uniref:Uncharacterized protein n=1 Tax=Portunus trituberculatus TaxID=210409 RepID=A0A5B7DCV2_PORTR|nr:hypothetical protein [Portunus trituberculatus]
MNLSPTLARPSRCLTQSPLPSLTPLRLLDPSAYRIALPRVCIFTYSSLPYLPSSLRHRVPPTP